jgi:hypothetical protein
MPLGPKLVLIQSAIAKINDLIYLWQLGYLWNEHLCFSRFYCMMLALELWIQCLIQTSQYYTYNLNIFKIEIKISVLIYYI